MNKLYPLCFVALSLFSCDQQQLLPVMNDNSQELQELMTLTNAQSIQQAQQYKQSLLTSNIEVLNPDARNAQKDLELAEEQCVSALNRVPEAMFPTINTAEELLRVYPDNKKWKSLCTSLNSAIRTVNQTEDDQLRNLYLQQIHLLLLNLQTELLYSEHKVDVTYDRFTMLAQPKKSQVRKGETFEAELCIGAYSSQVNYSVNVNGRALKVEEGKSVFTQRANELGEQSYKVVFKIVNPLTGKAERFERTFYYEVVN